MSKFLHDDDNDVANAIAIPRVSPKTAELKQEKHYTYPYSKTIGAAITEVLVTWKNRRSIRATIPYSCVWDIPSDVSFNFTNPKSRMNSTLDI